MSFWAVHRRQGLVFPDHCCSAAGGETVTVAVGALALRAGLRAARRAHAHVAVARRCAMLGDRLHRVLSRHAGAGPAVRDLFRTARYRHSSRRPSRPRSSGWASMARPICRKSIAPASRPIHRGQMEAALSLGMTPLRAHAVHRPAAGDPHHAAADHQLRDRSSQGHRHRLRRRRSPEIMALARNLVTETLQSAAVYLIAGAHLSGDDHPDVAACRPSRTPAPGMELRRPRHAGIVRDL